MITVNLYYTGTNGNARKFAEEMEGSGIADQIRAEEGNIRYNGPPGQSRGSIVPGFVQ